MHNHAFDLDIARLARRQHGVFNLAQVRAAGGSRTMVGDRVDRGSWVRLAPTVWTLASFPPTWHRRCKAAELSIPGAALADRAAAALHGFEGFRAVRPALAIPYTANPRSAIADLRRTNPLPTTVVDGIRVTSIAQTLFDLLRFATVDLHTIERAMDGALLDKRLSVEELRERRQSLARSRRPHVSTWAALVEERSATGWQPPAGELEAVLGRVLACLPPDIVVVPEADLPWWTPGEGRVDALLPGWRLIVEADGRRWHGRVADFERDRWRDNVANAHGHRVLRFTHAHLTRRPDEVLELLLGAGDYTVVRRAG